MWRWLAFALLAGVGLVVWISSGGSPRAPGGDVPSSRLFVADARVISYPVYGFEFRVPEGWWIDDYFDDDQTFQSGDTIIDNSVELSKFINLRNRAVIDAELDLVLTPDFDDDDLPMLPYQEYAFGEGEYRARYVADCTGERLIYIERKGKKLLVRPAEFCDTPAYQEFDIDATFRAIAEGFRFME